jgi:hypothetical protein
MGALTKMLEFYPKRQRTIREDGPLGAIAAIEVPPGFEPGLTVLQTAP